MGPHPPEPLLAHRLPPAPHFVGRAAELRQLRDLWRCGFRGVAALVGLGGAGKTAVAARFLDGLARPGEAPRPDGLLVWSFYQEPDPGLFLQTACQYFTPEATPPHPTLSPILGGEGRVRGGAKGAGLLHLLGDALVRGGPHLLVLDGLERVQRPEGAAFGQVEDPLLRGLLTRLAAGAGRTTVLVTSRFPLTDLASVPRTYRQLDVGGLDPDAAVALLRGRGVHGDDEVLRRLVEAYGAHALTLDHLGGLIGQFLGGDPARAPEAPALADPGGDRQALRLARLLRAYEAHLPPAELALLCRLCLLRRSVRAEQLVPLFQCSPPIHRRTVKDLAERLEHLSRVKGYPGHELRDLTRGITANVAAFLHDAPLAGPEPAFRQELIDAVERFLDRHEEEIEVEVGELARLYKDDYPDVPTDLRPLPREDRWRLRELCARYVELQNYSLPDPDLPPT